MTGREFTDYKSLRSLDQLGINDMQYCNSVENIIINLKA